MRTRSALHCPAFCDSCRRIILYLVIVDSIATDALDQYDLDTPDLLLNPGIVSLPQLFCAIQESHFKVWKFTGAQQGDVDQGLDAQILV